MKLAMDVVAAEIRVVRLDLKWLLDDLHTYSEQAILDRVLDARDKLTTLARVAQKGRGLARRPKAANVSEKARRRDEKLARAMKGKW